MPKKKDIGDNVIKVISNKIKLKRILQGRVNVESRKVNVIIHVAIKGAKLNTIDEKYTHRAKGTAIILWVFAGNKHINLYRISAILFCNFSLSTFINIMNPPFSIKKHKRIYTDIHNKANQ